MLVLTVSVSVCTLPPCWGHNPTATIGPQRSASCSITLAPHLVSWCLRSMLSLLSAAHSAAANPLLAVGTPGYVSPEVIEKRPHGPPVDMWAMGVVLYMLLGGYPPFYEPDDNQKAIYKKILAADYEFHPENWSEISAGMANVARSLCLIAVSLCLSLLPCFKSSMRDKTTAHIP